MAPAPLQSIAEDKEGERVREGGKGRETLQLILSRQYVTAHVERG